MIYLSLLPFALIIFVVVLMKRSSIEACVLALMLVTLIVLSIKRFSMSQESLMIALDSSIILSLSAFIVLLAGFYLNDILKKLNIIESIAIWFRSIDIDLERKILILLLGLLPAVESLTGFGISLFLSIPILIQLVNTEQAIKLSLLGMNIMPWGTLALASMVGASIINIPLNQLSIATSLTSFFVFPLIGLLALYILGGKHSIVRNGLFAIILGFSLSTLILLNSIFLFPETAGIISGLGVTSIGFLTEILKQGNRQIFPKNSNIFKIAFPYFFVFFLIALVRGIPQIWEGLSNAIILRSHNIAYSPLTSPGIALFITGIYLHLKRKVTSSIKNILTVSLKPILVITLYLLLSQLMIASSMISNITQSLTEIDNTYLYILSPLIGFVSGFSTGSNLSGNALSIAMQYGIGSSSSESILLAAVQNSSAGHSVFVSLPLIALVTAIFASRGSDRLPSDAILLKFALGRVAFILTAIVPHWLSVRSESNQQELQYPVLPLLPKCPAQQLIGDHFETTQE